MPTLSFGNGPDFVPKSARGTSYQYGRDALANGRKTDGGLYYHTRRSHGPWAPCQRWTWQCHRPRHRTGPRMQVATRGIQTNGGFHHARLFSRSSFCHRAEGVDSHLAAREAVRDKVAHDADLIKRTMLRLSFNPRREMLSPRLHGRGSRTHVEKLTRGRKSILQTLAEKVFATA